MKSKLDYPVGCKVVVKTPYHVRIGTVKELICDGCSVMVDGAVADDTLGKFQSGCEFFDIADFSHQEPTQGTYACQGCGKDYPHKHEAE